jgi:hypothetical protein
MRSALWTWIGLAVLVGCGTESEGAETDTGALSSDRDVAIPKHLFTTIQANLCVAQTGTLDPATSAAIRQAKIGARAVAQASSTAPFDNIDAEIKTDVEAQKFLDARSCSMDFTGAERGYRTAFEKFRFPGPVAIKGLGRLLNACGHRLEESETFTPALRSAIAAVKAKAPNGSSGESDTLDDASYAFMRRNCIL